MKCIGFSQYACDYPETKPRYQQARHEFKELLTLGLSVRKIASLLGYTNHFAPNTYVNKRKLREQL
jgi:hypothetical protein